MSEDKKIIVLNIKTKNEIVFNIRFKNEIKCFHTILKSMNYVQRYREWNVMIKSFDISTISIFALHIV